MAQTHIVSGPHTVDESIALLERTPRILRTILVELPESWLTEPDTVGGWTARDVIGHLISAELDDWIPRAEIILRDGTNRPFDPFDRFAHVDRDAGVQLPTLIERRCPSSRLTETHQTSPGRHSQLIDVVRSRRGEDGVPRTRM